MIFLFRQLVNNLSLSCLLTIVIQVPHWWLHYLKHSPSFECAMCRSHNVFRYVLRKLSFLVMCFTTTYLFLKQQALFVNMTERFHKYICHVYSNNICKYIYVYIKRWTFIKFKGALDMEHLIWLGWSYSHIHNSKILNALYVHCFPWLRVPVLFLKFVCINIFYVRWN